MVKFLEMYNLPKLNQGEKESLNIQITREIEALIKKLSAHKHLDWMKSQWNFT